MAFDGRRVLLFGGTDTWYQNDTWLYDGAAWVQGPSAPAMLTARNYASIAHDATRNALVLLGEALHDAFQ